MMMKNYLMKKKNCLKRSLKKKMMNWKKNYSMMKNYLMKKNCLKRSLKKMMMNWKKNCSMKKNCLKRMMMMNY